MSQQPTDPQDYGDAAGAPSTDPTDVVDVSDRVGADGPAASANQRKAEEMPASPSQGGPGTDGPNTSVGSGDTAEPGPAATTVAAPGSGESRPASAVPGKPDGEVDTRV